MCLSCIFPNKNLQIMHYRRAKETMSHLGLINDGPLREYAEVNILIFQ